MPREAQQTLVAAFKSYTVKKGSGRERKVTEEIILRNSFRKSALIYIMILLGQEMPKMFAVLAEHSLLKYKDISEKKNVLMPNR